MVLIGVAFFHLVILLSHLLQGQGLPLSWNCVSWQRRSTHRIILRTSYSTSRVSLKVWSAMTVNPTKTNASHCRDSICWGSIRIPQNLQLQCLEWRSTAR
jgi:hypothetical protein